MPQWKPPRRGTRPWVCRGGKAEVRSLAQHQCSSRRRSRPLIDDSAAKVGIGTQLVERAGTTMGDVVRA